MANDLNLTTIASNAASGQWQASNDGDANLADALSDIYTVDFTSGDVTLTAALYRRAMVFVPSNLGANRNLILPAVKRPFVFHNTDSTYTVTLKSTDGASPETAETIEVSPGEICLGYTDGTTPGLEGSVFADSTGTSEHPYDIPLSYAGTPTSSELIGKIMTPRAVTFAANFSGSYGHVAANPASTYEIDVQDDGSSIGTISINTSGVFTFTTSGGTSKVVAAGSRIEFYAPSASPPDAAISAIAATLVGTVNL